MTKLAFSILQNKIKYLIQRLESHTITRAEVLELYGLETQVKVMLVTSRLTSQKKTSKKKT